MRICPAIQRVICLSFMGFSVISADAVAAPVLSPGLAQQIQQQGGTLNVQGNNVTITAPQSLNLPSGTVINTNGGNLTISGGNGMTMGNPGNPPANIPTGSKWVRSMRFYKPVRAESSFIPTNNYFSHRYFTDGWHCWPTKRRL